MASSSSEKAVRPEESGGLASSEAGASLWSDQQLLFRGIKKAKKERGCTAKDRISRMPPCTAGKRSSIYRGVTRHRWTGRYEAHLWDKSTWNEIQNKKGKQVYLGAYDEEEAAARAYDLAALKYWGPGTHINFQVKDYARDLEEMQNVSREEYLASLRRKSSGFSRGMSKYRTVSSSRWDTPCDHTQKNEAYHGLYGEGLSTVGLSSGRKIDLSNYIKWWSSNRSNSSDVHSKASEKTDLGCPEDIASEVESLELLVQPTEPFQMPCLGVPLEKIKHTRISAMSILMQSAAYSQLKEKVSKAKDKDDEGNEKDNQADPELLQLSEKLCDDEMQFQSGGVPLENDAYPLSSLLSAPLLTHYNTIDTLADPATWSSFIPILPPGSSGSNEGMKNESASDYTFFQPDE